MAGSICLEKPDAGSRSKARLCRELNLIEESGRYGWPYCYDDGKPAPEYPKLDCAGFRVPLVLLPAHAAPLGMTYYFGTLLPRAPTDVKVGTDGAIYVTEDRNGTVLRIAPLR